MSRLSTDNIKVTWKIFALFACVWILSVESRNDGFDSGQQLKLGVVQVDSHTMSHTIGADFFMCLVSRKFL